MKEITLHINGLINSKSKEECILPIKEYAKNIETN